MAYLVASLTALVFAFVGSLPLAGPIAVLVVSNGFNGRYKDALEVGLGAAVAEGVYAFLAFWGFATFLSRYQIILPISHGVTAALLAALGVYFLFYKVKDPPKSTRERGGRAAKFWLGFSVSIVNPTLLVTWSAVTTFLYSKQILKMTGTMAIPFGASAAAGVALWALMMVALMKKLRDKFPRQALAWVVRVMGVVLIGVAVWSGVELVRYLVNPASRHDVAGLRATAQGMLEARRTGADSSVGRAADF